MKKTLGLILVGALCALVSWMFYHYFQYTAFNIIIAIVLTSVLIKNINSLRK